MKALCKLFVLLLASFALASCGGGGGGGSNSAFGGGPALTVTVTASPSSITTNSFTTITISVKNPDGSAAANGTVVGVSLTPSTIGSLSVGTTSGGSVSTTLTSGTASVVFNSSNQTGTAQIAASVAGGNTTNTGSVNVNISAGNGQDPRLQLTASATTLPLNPYAAEAETFPFPSNYLGSPWISEVTITWRHSNGQLVAGTLKANVSIDPVSLASFSTLDDPTTPWTGETKSPPTNEGNEFLTLLGSGPVNVTGGNGVVFVHANDTPGTAVLSVTGIDPDSGQTISSQLAIVIAGASSSLPSSIYASSPGNAYVSGSSGPQSTVVNAAVTDGNDAFVPDPAGYDNVEFSIVGPAGSDARLTGINAAGQSITGATVDTVTHNGIANVTFQAGAQQGPVQIKATADRGDANVDNGIQDGVSSTTTVVVSDGKLYRLTISAPNASEVTASGTSDSATSSDNGATYDLPVTVSGVDRLQNPALPGTVIAFGGVDSPQSAKAGTGPQSWFLNSGNSGDPQEGGTLFTATGGHFTTGGGGAGPGDTLLVFGKQVTSPNNNDDLESARNVQSISTATSLNVTAPFNRNDTVTGVVVNSGPVLPYVLGRALLGSIESPASMDSDGTNSGRATTTLHYPASAIGKAIAIWAQGNGTDTVTGGSDTVADIATLVYPGAGPGSLTASPDPLLGDASVPVTVCYSDANNQPIPNFTLSFLFSLPAGASGSVDNISTSGNLDKVTGSDGCVTVTVLTSGLPPTSGSGGPTLTFTAGAAVSSSGAQPPSVTLDFVVNISAMQVSPCSIKSDGTGAYSGTVTATVLSAGGSGISGQTISAACTVTGSGSVTITPTSAITGSNGSAPFMITLTGVVQTTDTGSCLFTGPDNLQAKLVINGSCSNSGFSPPAP
ncbi:MAG: beta strand repeat-containing protein [Rudaea sp.]